jgi:phenylalanyl-tRNA synthetase beta chain
MKISYRWLKEHVALDLAAEDVAKHLAALGLEVADLQKLGPQFTGVVSGEILSIDKHPNADRLSLCKVTDGGATYSVVCGAKNIAVGQKIPLAKIGAALPGGFKISRSKIRGVESEGMICSDTELGLGTESSGIKVLDAATALGLDLAQTLGEKDEILDVEVTPNRPDCLSHLGLARELAAFFRIPLKARTAPALPAAQGKSFPVSVEDEAACPRYLGRLVEGLEIKPSPAWLASRLTAIGLRPINNVVDVTNFILMDLGQPLHAFDADLLEGGKIVVRRAKAGERLKALDGKDYALSPNVLVIADAAKPQAIAGIMGGEPSSVTDKTKRIFLESAYFTPAAVRKASSELRLRSDSSQRLERGTDREAVPLGASRALEIILSVCRNAKLSEPAEASAPRDSRAPIKVTTARINEILGSTYAAADVEGCLAAVGKLSKAADALTVEPPSHRHDLATPWDLAEETARLLGYGTIPYKTPSVALKPKRPLPGPVAADRARARLAGLGLFEAYNYDFISQRLFEQGRQTGEPVKLANPLNEDWTILRPTLLIGLLQNAALNLNRGAASVRIFELGKTYARQGAEVAETLRLSGLLFGARRPAHWQGKADSSDVFEAKGLVEDLTSGLAGRKWTALSGESGLFHPRESVELSIPEGRLGRVGALHPQAARAWDLTGQPAAIFELDFDLLAGLPQTEHRFAPFSAFPSSRRDLSVFVPKETSYEAVEAAVRACKLEDLRELELLDLFTGKGVPEGKKSITLRLSFGRDDRTLRDTEVAAAFDRVVGELTAKVSAILRA